MKAEFTQFNNKDTWVKGTVGGYNFEAKLYDNVSKFGINNGRVSKLAIWDEDYREEYENFDEACVVVYERGWELEPFDDDDIECYNAVMELLENSPKRFS